MTAAWSNSPFPRKIPYRDVRTEGDVIGSGGETKGVMRLAAPHQDWIFKPYHTPVSPAPLERLINFPSTLGSDDLGIVDKQTSWPVAAVVDDLGHCVGCLLPVAPAPFWATLTLPSGRRRRQLLAVDHLARPSQRQEQLGLRGQAMDQRLAVCASFTSVASLFERSGLVYLDWSFSNVLWSELGHEAYVIDLDGASFGPRQQIGSQMFEDPMVPMKVMAGVEVDRYRLALLVAWCLTGMSPDLPGMRNELRNLAAGTGPAAPIAGLLNRTFQARRLAERVEIWYLHDALRVTVNGTSAIRPRPDAGRASSSVRNWKPIDPERRAGVNLNPDRQAGIPRPVTPPAASGFPVPGLPAAGSRPTAPPPSSPSTSVGSSTSSGRSPNPYAAPNPSVTAAGGSGGCLTLLLTLSGLFLLGLLATHLG
jgi:hypothetical protein